MAHKVVELVVGAKVHYKPEHHNLANEFENGIIKEVRPGNSTNVWVVYNCNGDWANYKNYTGCNTEVKDLRPGWGQIW